MWLARFFGTSASTPAHSGFEAAAPRWAAFRVTWVWGAFALATVVFAAALTAVSSRFGYDVEVIDMPTLGLAAGLVAAGAVFALALPLLVRRSDTAPRPDRRVLLLIIIGAGLLARLILFASEPILEDDYQRYLWDGAVTAHAHNPYAASPLAVHESGAKGELAPLATQSGAVIHRINSKHLTTIYPPVAQAAFAIAYLIEPWSLTAWRCVLLACDLATLVLLLVLLEAIGLSPLWVALYWLNPVVLKELFNSAHMDAVIFPFVLLSLLLAARRRPVLATTALGFAAGVKFWPILLAPLIWRASSDDWRTVGWAAVLFSSLILLWLAPMAMAGLDENAGLVAYVEHWKTNSALFPLLEQTMETVLQWGDLPNIPPTIAAKAMIGAVLVSLAAVLAWHPVADLHALVGRSTFIVAALLLLSPAQYPWYTTWLAPFLVFRPYRAFLVLIATIPLYYASFHFASREIPEVFSTYVVWVIWAPVWAMLGWDLAVARRKGRLPFSLSHEGRAHALRS